MTQTLASGSHVSCHAASETFRRSEGCHTRREWEVACRPIGCAFTISASPSRYGGRVKAVALIRVRIWPVVRYGLLG